MENNNNQVQNTAAQAAQNQAPVNNGAHTGGMNVADYYIKGTKVSGRMISRSPRSSFMRCLNSTP